MDARERVKTYAKQILYASCILKVETIFFQLLSIGLMGGIFSKVTFIFCKHYVIKHTRPSHQESGDKVTQLLCLGFVLETLLFCDQTTPT